MAQIIAVSNQKGGVGKTTSTLNLGVALTELGMKVLMIDLDPQASLTISIGLEPENLEKTIYNALIDDVDIRKLILFNELLYFVPSTIDLSAAEMELVSEVGREFKLRDALDPVKADFDYILIDCPPSLGLLTINALAACDAVIVPMSPEYLALRGFNLLEKTMAKVKRLNKKLTLMGILITLYDNRTTHHKDVVAELRNSYPVFNSMIKKSIKFPDAVLAGQPIMTFDRKFEGSISYQELAKEVITWDATK
ncbi:ParA family protein [Clostridium tagluense]|uniref:ParA family protein n=1 Tax=Clostridium tagluense TaxID=360422 RepID=UPI001CF4CD93|nr:AAA family ATPase [Clostridium tagluense]MCB2299562.1 ParA family protein [Clostridium tagluense]MCB2311884.1 ParA family protein [Clostridium tagluense]MCB2317362.1 ParA family protein [Clostridium tagluense]MCB2322846.1 ParA family protein [Clostridium tagluense]MCB2326916.1 ParA family protein [Clostridium tagluense]